jgi:hypothetical protein
MTESVLYQKVGLGKLGFVHHIIQAPAAYQRQVLAVVAVVLFQHSHQSSPTKVAAKFKHF